MQKKAYFISDLHLGASYIADTHKAERRVIEWLESVRGDMGELYLLGDILDYWYEYRYVVPRGYVRFFGKLAELSDAGVKIRWFIGNHDIWIFDYLPCELGIEVIDGSATCEILGQKFFLAHGYASGCMQPCTHGGPYRLPTGGRATAGSHTNVKPQQNRPIAAV